MGTVRFHCVNNPCSARQSRFGLLCARIPTLQVKRLVSITKFVTLAPKSGDLVKRNGEIDLAYNFELGKPQ